MRNLEQYPNQSKSSFLYFQLGLLSALIVVYVFLEWKTEKIVTVSTAKEIVVDISEKPFLDKIVIEKEQQKKEVAEKKPEKKKVITDAIKPIKNDTEDADEADLASEDESSDEETADLGETTNNEEEAGEEEIALLGTLDENPTFKSCAHLKGAARDQCFKEQFARFLQRNLDYPERAKEGNEQETIFVEFIIGKDGKVQSVKPLRTSKSKLLEKEALQTISRLPEMDPGKRKGKPVAVRYTVPVSFRLR